MRFTNVSKIGFLFVVILGTSIGSVLAQQNTNKDQELTALKKRVNDMDAQILNMQVIIGSLESLIKQQKTTESQAVNQFDTQSSSEADNNSSYGSETSSERVSILETKVQALTAQIEQLTNQLQQGSTAKAINNRQNGSESNQQLSGLSGDNSSGGNAALDYDKAYGHLLRRDYSAAEKAFIAFLGKYKNDTLAGNAQYWLGETYFQRANYKKAADSFLKSYSKYRQGPKAPDSLLKLALSLNKLGQNRAACSTVSELSKNYPQAPKHVSNRVAKLSNRLGC